MPPRRDPTETPPREPVTMLTADQLTEILRAVQPPPQDLFFKRNEAFVGLGGQIFHGEMGPKRSEKWLRDTEAVFRRMDLTEREKTQLAIYQFVGSA